MPVSVWFLVSMAKKHLWDLPYQLCPSPFPAASWRPLGSSLVVPTGATYVYEICMFRDIAMVSAVEKTWVVFRQAPVTCFGLVKATPSGQMLAEIPNYGNGEQGGLLLPTPL